MTKKQKKTAYIIGISFFLIYLFVSTMITYKYSLYNVYNYFFDADTARVVRDMVDVMGNHYRTAVHPLFVIIFLPLTRVINLFFADRFLAITFIMSIIGAINTCLLYSIFCKIKAKEKLSVLLCLIYGFSFSSILFSIIPETYVISACCFLMFWNYFLKQYQNNKSLNTKGYIVLIILGILNLAITLTNIIPYGIGLIFLIYKKEEKSKLKNSVLKSLLIGMIILLITWLLAVIQKMIFIRTEIFLDYLLLGAKSEEANYINLNISISTITNATKAFFAHSFIAPKIVVKKELLLFGSYSIFIKTLVLAFVFTFIALITKLFKDKKLKNNIAIPLFLSLLYNIFLHFIYGNDTAFLYTQHALFIIIILIAISISGIKNKKTFNYIIAFLIFFLIATVIQNFISIKDILYITKELYISIPKGTISAFIIALLKTVFILSPICILMVSKKYKKIWITLLAIIPVIVAITLNYSTLIYRPFQSQYQDEQDKINYYQKELRNYELELSKLRKDLKLEKIDISTEEFMIFGMGNRRKLWFHQGMLSDQETKRTLMKSKVSDVIILPSEYSVIFNDGANRSIEIIEDEEAVWIIKDGIKTPVSGTEMPVKIPTFEGYEYSRVMKVLYQEMIINIKDGKPIPNILVYDEPWYRDALMTAMVLEKLDNIELIRSWIINLDKIYDEQNGNKEPDNLGQVLYLISMVSNQNHPLVKTILEEANKIAIIDNGQKYISGITDGSNQAAYQTILLKEGFKRLELSDNFTVPEKGNYSSLAWFSSYNKEPQEMPGSPSYPYLNVANYHTNGKGKLYTSNRNYPLTWESNAAKANYKKVDHMKNYLKKNVSPTHAWHAAELLLLLMDGKNNK